MAANHLGWTSFILISIFLSLSAQFALEGPFLIRRDDRGEKGRCAQVQIDRLHAAFDEAIVMAANARRACQYVAKNKYNWDDGTNEKRISGALRAIFGIKTGKRLRAMTDQDRVRLEYVMGKVCHWRRISRLMNLDVYGAIENVDQDQDEGHKYPLYCNDEWIEWTKVQKDNGQPFAGKHFQLDTLALSYPQGRSTRNVVVG